eukprot:UN06159
MLRDPVQRAISEYNYFCVEGAEQRKKWLEEWKENNECPLNIIEYFGIGNHSIAIGSPRLLIGRLSRSTKKDICNIQIAKKNLLNGCVRYLLLEQYADGLQKLQKTFGESFVDTNLKEKKQDIVAPKRNSHSWTDRTMSQINNNDTMKVMRHLLRDDIEFYEFAVQNYELQWDK